MAPVPCLDPRGTQNRQLAFVAATQDLQWNDYDVSAPTVPSRPGGWRCRREFQLMLPGIVTEQYNAVWFWCSPGKETSRTPSG